MAALPALAGQWQPSLKQPAEGTGVCCTGCTACVCTAAGNERPWWRASLCLREQSCQCPPRLPLLLQHLQKTGPAPCLTYDTFFLPDL